MLAFAAVRLKRRVVALYLSRAALAGLLLQGGSHYFNKETRPHRDQEEEEEAQKPNDNFCVCARRVEGTIFGRRSALETIARARA